VKRIFSILIITCLLVYIGGYHLVYAVYQLGIKQEMKAYLKSHKDINYGSYFQFRLDKQKVQDASFEWEEENEEFRYRGDYYDIVSIQSNADSIQICALKDGRENDLEKKLTAIHSQPDQSQTASISFIKHFPAFYFSRNSLVFSPHNTHSGYPITATIGRVTDKADILTPPPRV